MNLLINNDSVSFAFRCAVRATVWGSLQLRFPQVEIQFKLFIDCIQSASPFSAAKVCSTPLETCTTSHLINYNAMTNKKFQLSGFCPRSTRRQKNNQSPKSERIFHLHPFGSRSESAIRGATGHRSKFMQNCISSGEVHAPRPRPMTEAAQKVSAEKPLKSRNVRLLHTQCLRDF